MEEMDKTGTRARHVGYEVTSQAVGPSVSLFLYNI
jgi:hypothetical protein